MLRLDGVLIQQGDFLLSADVAFAAGAITALIGPSGAGKSPIQSVIAGFLAVRRGGVLWQGEDLAPLVPGERPVSILFQDNNLFPHLTVAQNVGLGISPSLRLTVDQAAQVEATLAGVGLQGLGARRPGALSGGQQSRVALARVLVADRPIVLLDEPFAALGPGLKDEMLDLVKSRLVADGKTVVMVTHDPSDARRIADQTALVAEGQVHAPVATARLFDDPPPALVSYLG